jgi:hypothetical protein
LEISFATQGPEGEFLKAKHEKTLSALACLLGISGIAYGMIRQNHPIFVVGICFVVGGYLFIRKKLKKG